MNERSGADKTPILLTSLPRSGSTWVMKMLAASGKLNSHFQPDHLDEWNIGDPGMHPYMNVHKEDSSYQSMYKKIFEGEQPFSAPNKLSRRYVMHLTQRMQDALSNRQLLVKSVYSLHNTEWLAERFPLRIVILLRNPCSIVHSIHRRWPQATLKNPQEQGNFLADYLRPHRDLFVRAGTPYEILASRVGAYYLAAAEAASRHPEWIVVHYEDLCADPVKSFEQLLFKRLGLGGFEKAKRVIETANQPKVSDDIQHVQRVAGEEVDKWKQNLSDEDISQIAAYYCPFNSGWYKNLNKVPVIA